MSFADQLHHLPELAELRHDLARQVRLAGPGHAGEEQALAVEAVQEGVLHALPARRPVQVGRLDARLPVLALQALALLEAVHGRAVSMLPGRELPHRRQELLGQVLEDKAVRLERDDVAWGHLLEVAADLGDGHVLLRHDVVVEGPQCVVAEELRGVDVVPVHLAGGVREGLAPLAARGVQLVVAGAHAVHQVLVPGPIDAELGHVLLALRPGVLHGLQRLGQAAGLHVRLCVQRPLEIAPGRLVCFQQVRGRGLGAPAPARVGELLEQSLPVVAVQVHVGEVSSGLKTGRGKVALARAFLRQRTTSTPQQTRSGSHFASLQTSGGGRGLCT